jgi:hypothetical protein
MVLEVLRCDVSLQIDEIPEALETQLTSSEVFYGSLRTGDGGADTGAAGKELCADDVKKQGLVIWG